MKAAPKTKKAPARPAAERALYLYAISQMPERVAENIAAEGIDGKAEVEALRCEDYVCWISRVSKVEFADRLTENMQDLEWLASAGLRHQRAVAAISQQSTALPTRFGTIFLSDDSLRQHVKERKTAMRKSFERVADADEWGIKLFDIAKPKPRVTAAASGSDYLKKKAELMQPRTNKKLDDDSREFVSALTKLAVAASPGGKASAGQPGLLWHGSFLIRRKDRKKLESTLKKYASKRQDTHRIDCSGPWPPYSFVEEHGS